MSHPVNRNPSLFSPYFSPLHGPLQRSEVRRTEEVSKRTVNTNLESTRKRTREEEARAPTLRLKISRTVLDAGRSQSVMAIAQLPTNRAPLRTVSSNLGAPMNNPQPARALVQPLPIDEVHPVRTVDPKKLKPSSDWAIKDARQVIWDKEHGISVSAQRVEYAEKILQEYKTYETNLTQEIQAQQGQEMSRKAFSCRRDQDIKRAWALVVGRTRNAPEDVKQYAKNIERSMEKFTPERQKFINELAEELFENQISLQLKEAETFGQFVEEILQVQSD